MGSKLYWFNFKCLVRQIWLFKCLSFCRDTEISYLILKYIFLSLLLEIILVIECYDFRYLPDALVFQRWKGRLHVVHHLLQIRPCTFQSRCQQQEQQRPRHTSWYCKSCWFFCFLKIWTDSMLKSFWSFPLSWAGYLTTWSSLGEHP